MKQLKKFLSYLSSPFTLGLVVTLAVTYASLDYYKKRHSFLDKSSSSIASVIQELHEKTIDWRLIDRGVAAGSDRVAILAIDEEAVDLEGRWPWPREKIGQLVEKTVGYGAKSISFDMIFSEEDNTSALPALTRLKRAIKDKPNAQADVGLALEAEYSKADSDRKFAEAIDRQSDHLILGTVFGKEVVSSYPLSDLCFDSHFERRYEGRYWKGDLIKLKADDPSLARVQLPADFKDHLSTYLMTLEASEVAAWFEKHPEIQDRIKNSLDDLGSDLPPETYSGLAVLALNNDYQAGKDMLGEALPIFSDIEKVRLAFSRLLSAFSKKEIATLQNSLNEVALRYCATRFLTPNDELLSVDKYQEIWGKTPESKEDFNNHSWAGLWQKHSVANPDGGKTETLEALIGRLQADSIPNSVEAVVEWLVNIPLLADATKHSGYFNAIQDTDGSVRRSRLITRYGNLYAPSLAFKAFLHDKALKPTLHLSAGSPGKERKAIPKGIQSLEVRDSSDKIIMELPVDSKANLMINYAGPRNMFPHVGASQIMNDDPEMIVSWRRLNEKTGQWEFKLDVKVNKKEFLKDKLLFLGATAIGIYDLRVTPFDENYPGVETHANVLSNLLVEYARATGEAIDARAPGFLRAHKSEEHVMWMILLVTGLTLSGLLTYFGSVAGLGITAAALAGIYAIDHFVLFRNGILVTIILPVFLIVSTFVSLTFYKYFGEEKKKRELKGTFEKYVSPAIVAEVLSDPSNIELGGKKVEMTVMFSDVRGFTTISEKLDPRALSDLLNSYLTPMTNLVFENKGTLDKYMGDAIMAFWGAPIHFADHAKHAARCALQMLVKLKELQAEYIAKGLPSIDIGIGLNTGEMSVGNMGSDTVRSYTVMGDAVNLGSRLEGINKEYGTRIIVSEFTHAAIKDEFVCREVDWVRVKGKLQPVRIFELVAEGKVPDETASLLKHFNEGFQFYHERKFQEAIDSFNAGLSINPDDAVSQLYVERCQDYLAEPPPAEWDGVYTMKTK